MQEVTVEELKVMLDEGIDFELIDIRENDERQINRIEQSRHIPMNILLANLDEFNKEKMYILQCRSGARSGRVVHEMEEAGFKRAYNLIGGINAWIDRIDPSQPIY